MIIEKRGKPKGIKMLSPSNEYFIMTLFSLRICLSVLVRSYFAPDEYYQSIEVSHKMAFGYGHLTWEWRSTEPIRSIVHPLFYAIPYYFLRIMDMDYGYLIAYLPRVMQGVLLFVTELLVYSIMKSLYSKATAQITLIVSLSSWFMGYSMVRTLSNSTETSILILALYLYLKQTKNIQKYDIINGMLYVLVFAIRPTAVLFIIPIVAHQIYKFGVLGFRNLLLSFLLASLPTFLFIITLDSIFYGKFTITMLNFLKFNVLEGISGYYGTHPFYWYVLMGLPLLLLSFTPLAIFQIIRQTTNLFRAQKVKLKDDDHHTKLIYKIIFRKQNQPLILLICGFEIFIMSLLPHKEERFLLPILPLLLGLAAEGYITLHRYYRTAANFILGFCVFTNIIFLIGWSSTYQIGSLEVMDKLRGESENNGENMKGIYFFTGCHNMPYYSHIHKNITMGYPDCSPNITKGYVSAAEALFRSPEGYAKLILDDYEYSHLVVHSKVYNRMRDFLNQRGYTQTHKIFHSIFAETPLGSDGNVYFYIFQHTKYK